MSPHVPSALRPALIAIGYVSVSGGAWLAGATRVVPTMENYDCSPATDTWCAHSVVAPGDIQWLVGSSILLWTGIAAVSLAIALLLIASLLRRDGTALVAAPLLALGFMLSGQDFVRAAYETVSQPQIGPSPGSLFLLWGLVGAACAVPAMINAFARTCGWRTTRDAIARTALMTAAVFLMGIPGWLVIFILGAIGLIMMFLACVAIGVWIARRPFGISMLRRASPDDGVPDE